MYQVHQGPMEEKCFSSQQEDNKCFRNVLNVLEDEKVKQDHFRTTSKIFEEQKTPQKKMRNLVKNTSCDKEEKPLKDVKDG